MGALRPLYRKALLVAEGEQRVIRCPVRFASLHFAKPRIFREEEIGMTRVYLFALLAVFSIARVRPLLAERQQVALL
jgi:hypothetical protein